MFVITKGELWAIRTALEEKESEAITDALGIVASVLDNDLTVEMDKVTTAMDADGIPREVIRMKLVPEYEEESEHVEEKE